MKLIELVTSRNHPAEVFAGCIITSVAVMAAAFVRGARLQHNHRKEANQICPYCSKGKQKIIHIQVGLSAKTITAKLALILSVKDYIVQKLALCQNPSCSYKAEEDRSYVKKGMNMPIVLRTQEKSWPMRSRITRFRELRHKCSFEDLVPNSVVLEIVRRRGIQGVVFQDIPISARKPISAIVGPATTPYQPFDDIRFNASDFIFNRATGPK